MRKLLVGLGVVTAIALVMAIRSVPSDAQTPQTASPGVLTASDSSKLAGPRQPIFFRHDLHAGELKMQCQYCHSTAQVSSEPGIPSMQTCMGCHMIIGGSTPENKAEIQKLKDAWKNQQPVQWIRIHHVARHVRFTHAPHIKALGPNACATCHGNVARMPQVYRVNNVNNMGWCINCHLERKVSRDCTLCHY